MDLTHEEVSLKIISWKPRKVLQREQDGSLQLAGTLKFLVCKKKICSLKKELPLKYWFYPIIFEDVTMIANNNTFAIFWLISYIIFAQFTNYGLAVHTYCI